MDCQFTVERVGEGRRRLEIAGSRYGTKVQKVCWKSRPSSSANHKQMPQMKSLAWGGTSLTADIPCGLIRRA